VHQKDQPRNASFDGTIVLHFGHRNIVAFRDITITSTSKGTTTAQELQPARTLWDWLELLAALAIPIVVGFGVAWFTSQQGKVSNAEKRCSLYSGKNLQKTLLLLIFY